MPTPERVEHEFSLDLLDDCIVNATGPDRDKLKNVRAHYVTWIIADRQAEASGQCPFCRQRLPHFNISKENIHA